jgi:hypothetical protein
MESWERINDWLSRLVGQGGYGDSEHSTDSLDESQNGAMEEWDHSNGPEAWRHKRGTKRAIHFESEGLQGWPAKQGSRMNHGIHARDSPVCQGVKRQRIWRANTNFNAFRDQLGPFVTCTDRAGVLNACSA